MRMVEPVSEEGWVPEPLAQARGRKGAHSVTTAVVTLALHCPDSAAPTPRTPPLGKHGISTLERPHRSHPVGANLGHASSHYIPVSPFISASTLPTLCTLAPHCSGAGRAGVEPKPQESLLDNTFKIF